ncbi:diphthine methyltransferase-like isoform X2 [Oculina patagonica]
MCTNTLCSLDTGYYADTVEWCPLEGFEDYLVCGTYQLFEKNDRDDVSAPCPEECTSTGNERIGNVQLYCLDESLGRLEKLQSFETAGVLDTKWLSNSLNGHAVLGAVTSAGELKQLVESASFITSPEKLCLSMDWSSKNGNSQVVVSDSAGQISLCEFNEGTSKLCQRLQWAGHQYEAWIVAFDAWNSSIVYSGGDDCLFRGWDTRTDCQKPTFTSKRHDMGVSSIQCNLSYEHIMATGSYDENILVWDTRNTRHPLCSSQPGGGVWRIKWHPVHGDTMLTACMYDGFHILKFNKTNGGQCLEKVVSYNEKASLAYGADWCRKNMQPSKELHREMLPGSEGNDELKDTDVNKNSDDTHTDLIATCSFYDHALNLWNVKL